MTEASPLVGSADWIAARLGKSRGWFYKNRARLEGQGFPKRDDLVNGWLTKDVEAWLERRRQVCDTVETHHTSKGINFDAL